MPQVKGGQKGRSSGGQGKKAPAKKPTPGRNAAVKQAADASSVVMSILFVLAILVGAAAWMGQSLSVVENKAGELADGTAKVFGFSIKSIRVIEATTDLDTELPPTLEKAIRDNIGVVQGDSMFRADPARIKERLESVKGIVDLQVHRFWPNQITISATPLETNVLYRDTDDGPVLAMSYTGKEAAELAEEAEYHLVQGVGSVEAWPVLADRLAEFPTLETRLSFAERIGDRRWDLIMTSGARVRLPAGKAEAHALKVLAALQRETGVLDREVEMIDLRDEDRVYVRRENTNYAEAQIGRAG